jgi:cardiolipin synthase
MTTLPFRTHARTANEIEHALARIIEVPLRGLALARFEPARKLGRAERRATAHLLGRGILGTLWHARRRSPSWDAVSRDWAEADDGDLYGRFAEGDRFTLVTDNRDAFAVRHRLCAAAKRSIDLSTYYLHDDDAGRAMLGSLAEAVRRGVRVRVSADAYIMQKKAYEGLGTMRLVDELRSRGVEVNLWHDPRRPYDTNHRKLLCVDEQSMLIGGRNIADHYRGDDWRDVELLIEGPSAREGTVVFAQTFAGNAREHAGPIVFATTPAGLGSHANFRYLLLCLRAARRTVDIENAYYFSHPAIASAMTEACQRGVRVRVFTNSAESNDLDYANYRLYSGFHDVLRSGAELWVRRGKGKTLHCKYFVADGTRVSLGSSNLDYYSPRYCTEANVHVQDDELGRKLTAWFEAGLTTADRITDREAVDDVLETQPISRAVDALLRDVQ